MSHDSKISNFSVNSSYLKNVSSTEGFQFNIMWNLQVNHFEFFEVFCNTPPHTGNQFIYLNNKTPSHFFTANKVQ